MFCSTKLSVHRTSREIARELRRHISKTSSVPNSDAISRQHDSQLKANFQLDANNRNLANKWSKLSRHNNIRALSTIQTKVKPPVAATPLVSKEESRQFMAIFPDIVRDLTDAGRHTDIPEVTKRLAKVLQYNVPTGKKIRGLSTVIAYKMLEKPENLTPENIRLANILGWCVELLRGFQIVNDDVVDNSEIRRGAPCWYRKDNAGLNAIHDGILLENSLYSILRKYFSTYDCYVPMVELFHDVTFKTAMGKSLDGIIKNQGRPNLEKFTMKNYSLMMKYKTGYYTFQLPVALAMYFANMYDPEQHRQAKTILLEMGQFFQIQLQAFFVIVDDVIDNSEQRRGAPCWFRNPDVGMQAMNDAILVESGVYQLLNKHFSSLPCYLPIMELFHDITFKTSMGQALDGLCMKNNRPNLDVFTMNRYSTIVKYKTAYYTFKLPVACAMYLANTFDEELHRQAKTILLEIGEFFQIQDDFLDCFGDPAVTGKKGNDIKEGKCSWLAVVALQRATPAQRKIMEEHYGRAEEESLQAIRNLYEELDLPSTYAVYEEESFNIIRTQIQQVSKGLPHDLFFKIMKQIYKRDC
ncbi:hypothetical protein NQ315_009567 [Exocentrus adspersus]|uniref:Farnesyl pyrophosphate synthase n=1 Tax=Exocentrus adspersus TaxID=1586481 RepID=A0AAV8WG45_9CUCU|nr:hypothetical protein NQ315_009567 [Exocentrus adspersus]